MPSRICLFASSIGPRSGNRGTCSGCCRLPYDVLDCDNNIVNKGKYPLSMKDLMTINELDKLIEVRPQSIEELKKANMLTPIKIKTNGELIINEINR